MPKVFPPRNLPTDAINWGREVENELVAVRGDLERLSQDTSNGGKANTSSMGLISQQISKIIQSIDLANTAIAQAQSAINSVAAQTALLNSFSPVAAAGDGTYRAVAGGTWGTDNLPSVVFTTQTGKVLVTVSGLLLSTGSATAIGTFAIYNGGTMIFSRDSLRSEFKGIVNGVLGGLGASYTYPATGLPTGVPLTARFEIYADAGTIQFKSPVIVVQGTP